MILQKINFVPLYKEIEKVFLDNLSKFSHIKTALLKEIIKLTNANFQCYQANMTIIAERKKEKINTQLISDMELQARLAGEVRVKTKITINKLLNKMYPLIGKKKIESTAWVSDDIVYSVGEMIDRLIIEFIKIHDYRFRLKHFKKNNDTKNLKLFKSKILFSQEWSRRVKNYLIMKLNEIDKKGYYEYLEETRTYEIFLKK